MQHCNAVATTVVQGPFVHIASIVATLLTRLVTSFQGIYANESRNSEADYRKFNAESFSSRGQYYGIIFASLLGRCWRRPALWAWLAASAHPSGASSSA